MSMQTDDPYECRGFPDRNAYLDSLADDYGMPIQDIKALADVLGEEEDFDALIVALEDWEEGLLDA